MENIQLNAHNKEEYPPMHTAEHILNQTMVRMFGCPRSRNAHIERKKSKCDYLLAECPTPEQVQAIVRVGDYDACACIGAHVSNTSEIGHFRILSHDFADGRWRVRFKVEG